MASVPPAASTLEPGYRLDRYELLCKIGQGGMASVWLARTQGKLGFERLVAIKTVLPEHTADAAFRTMLLDEARIAAAIDHPNVARILDVGEDRGMPYMVLEYVNGESINRLRRTLAESGKRVAPEILCRILADICGGLHAAHELTDKGGLNIGIVHRDVSPQNILVNERGIAKLIDFGVAKAQGRLATETATGIIKGKVPYMAPEQALGTGIDRRADIYSIGAVAYYLLAGAHAFDGPNDAARLIRALTGERPDPLPAGVPAAVSDVVFRSLAREAKDRFATAIDLRTALEAAMQGSGLAATAEDVARYFAEHLAEPAKARSKVFDRAMAAAEERARARAVLDFPPPSSPSVTGPRMTMPDSEGSDGIAAMAAIRIAPPRRSRVWIAPVAVLAVAALIGAGFAVGAITTRTHQPAALARTPVADPAPKQSPPAESSAVAQVAPPATLTTDLPSPAPSTSVAVKAAKTPAQPTATTKRPAPGVRPKKPADDGIF